MRKEYDFSKAQNNPYTSEVQKAVRLLKLRAQGFTDGEIERMLWLRAVEWNNWPAFLLQPIVPVLFIFFPIWQIIIALYILNILWCFIRYKFVNWTLANSAVFFVKLKWPAVLASSIYLFIQGRYWLGVICLLWPWLSGVVGIIPGQIGKTELLFAKHIGYVDQDVSLGIGVE